MDSVVGIASKTPIVEQPTRPKRADRVNQADAVNLLYHNIIRNTQ